MKVLSLLLIVIIFIGCIVACVSETGDKIDKSNSETTAPEIDELDIGRNIPDDLPQKNYNGRMFTIIISERVDFVDDIGTLFEETGDIVKDSVYSRNLTVEERFNIKLEADYVADPITKLRNTVLANEDVYDVILGGSITMGTSSLQGHYLDWYNDLPYINLDKPWYIGNARDALSIKNHSYLMIGEYDLSVLRFTYCMFFNKSIAERYQKNNIYEIVQTGKWTVDALHEMVKDVYEDVNGDGMMDENDLYGFTTDWHSSTVTYQYCFNDPIIYLNNEGIPEMRTDITKTVAIVDKLYSLFFNNTGSYVGTWTVPIPIFEANRALFLNLRFGSTSSFRNYEFDYGIIPYPKWDEAQPQYYTMSDGAHDVMAVPITINDPEFTSIIIEALNAETYKQVIPALYDTAFKVKYARDEMATEMLDMILEGRFFDFGYIYDGWEGIAFLLDSVLSRKSSDYASAYASREAGAIK